MFKFPLMPGSGEQELRHTGKSKQLSETSSFPESPACWCWLPPPSLPPRCWWLWLYKCYSDTVCLMSLVAMLQPWLVNIRNCPLCVCVHVCVCVCVYLLSHVWFFCDPHGLKPTRFFCPWDCPGKNTGVGCRFLLQGTFLTQEWNPCLLHLLHWQTDSLPLRHLETPHKSSKEKGLL